MATDGTEVEGKSKDSKGGGDNRRDERKELNHLLGKKYKK